MNSVDPRNLRDKSINHKEPNLMLRTWRRRHIESYLLWPAAIARAANRDEAEVTQLLLQQGVAITPNFADAEVPPALMDARGKDLFVLITQAFSVEPIDVVREMTLQEVCADIWVLVGQISALCSPQVNALLDAEQAAVEADERADAPAEREPVGAGVFG